MNIKDDECLLKMNIKDDECLLKVLIIVTLYFHIFYEWKKNKWFKESGAVYKELIWTWTRETFYSEGLLRRFLSVPTSVPPALLPGRIGDAVSGALVPSSTSCWETPGTGNASRVNVCVCVWHRGQLSTALKASWRTWSTGPPGDRDRNQDGDKSPVPEPRQRPESWTS